MCSLTSMLDGNIYVWQTNQTKPFEVLKGHQDTVNAVSWNPVASKRVFASCSDDGTIRVWQSPVRSDGVPQSAVAERSDDVLESAVEERGDPPPGDEMIL